MANYNSEYTGQQVDEAVGAVAMMSGRMESIEAELDTKASAEALSALAIEVSKRADKSQATGWLEYDEAPSVIIYDTQQISAELSVRIGEMAIRSADNEGPILSMYNGTSWVVVGHPKNGLIYYCKKDGRFYTYSQESLTFSPVSMGSGTSDRTIVNVNALQAKIDELISKLANYALSSEVLPVGTLDWGESGGGGDDQPVAQTPVLTSPTNNSSYNIGEIAYNGTSVSKQIYIKGSNLTQPLTIAISGTGLSVSTNEVTASQANSGVYVTITYTNSTSGAASTSGTLTISSNELSNNVVISLMASKAAEEVVVGDYVTDGLILHLDGKNQGDDSGIWKDTVGDKEFRLIGGATSGANGVEFASEGAMGVYEDSSNPEWYYNECTIEVCFTPRSDFGGVNRVLFGNSIDSGIAAVFSYPKPQTQGWAFGVMSDNDYPTPGNTSKRRWQGTLSGLTTLSMNTERMIINNSVYVDTLEQTKLGRAKGTNVQLTVGGMVRINEGTDEATFYADSIIHEVRIYSRNLSQAEMEHNRQVDNSRYSN